MDILWNPSEWKWLLWVHHVDTPTLHVEESVFSGGGSHTDQSHVELQLVLMAPALGNTEEHGKLCLQSPTEQNLGQTGECHDGPTPCLAALWLASIWPVRVTSLFGLS